MLIKDSWEELISIDLLFTSNWASFNIFLLESSFLSSKLSNILVCFFLGYFKTLPIVKNIKHKTPNINNIDSHEV